MFQAFLPKVFIHFLLCSVKVCYFFNSIRKTLDIHVSSIKLKALQQITVILYCESPQNLKTIPFCILYQKPHKLLRGFCFSVFKAIPPLLESFQFLGKLNLIEKIIEVGQKYLKNLRFLLNYQ